MVLSIQVEDILLKVCDEKGIELDEILSNSRKDHIVEARYEAMLRLNIELKMSSTSIGRIFKRTHASVLHAWREAEINRVTQIKKKDFIQSLIEEKIKLTKRLKSIDSLLDTY